jgi:hypothetical protein
VETGVPFLLTIEFDGGPELLRKATRVQLVARKYGFRPLWLMGVGAYRHPAVLEHAARWQLDGEAEVGVLLDAARVPPLVDLGHRETAPTLVDYPDKVMDEKLAWATAALTQALPKAPVSIRSVPAATDERYYAALVRHGYKVDLTVVPHVRVGSRDFRAYSEKLYLTPQGVFEVPWTVRRRERGLWHILLGVPPIRSLRLGRGHFTVARRLALESLKAAPDHLDLRISAEDWHHGETLVAQLERLLPAVQTAVVPVTGEELLVRYKNEQLRKGLL